MTIKEISLELWPAWMMGLLMLILVKESKYADILRIDKVGMIKFFKFLAFITILRLIAIKFVFPPQEVVKIHEMSTFLPWQASFGVFWEDMCHAVPLVLLSKIYSKNKWYNMVSLPLLAIVMFSFGSGHIYQGLLPAFGISFYIPFTMRMGQKYGFGTVILAHILYDLSTMLSFRFF